MKRKKQIDEYREKKADYRAGIIASVIANVNTPKEKSYSPEDFMPREKEKKQQNWKDQLTIIEMINAAFGGKDMRGGGSNSN